MENIFANIRRFKKHISRRHILLFLDYDGTLTPIAKTPRQAVMPPGVKEILRGLSGNSRCTVIILSGRELKDIKKKVGLPGIIYGGNHGMEIEGPGFKFRRQPQTSYRRLLKSIKTRLRKKFKGYKGILLEDKKLSLAIHYRRLSAVDLEGFKAVFMYVIVAAALLGKIKLSKGKKVFEIKPPIGWDKGKAALWILKHYQRLCRGRDAKVIYIGDDRTDEDAFRVLTKKGLTIAVGKTKHSQARYYVNSPEEVFALLKCITQVLCAV